MSADKDAFLAGAELPDAALVKSMMVNTGKQGVHDKLKGLGKSHHAPTPSHAGHDSHRYCPKAGTRPRQ